jgi:HK97 gp10 family phage protein
MGNVLNQLNRLEHVGESAGAALIKVGMKMMATARALCPVDTGDLRNSITAHKSLTKNAASISVAPHMSYAPYVEFGTGGAGIKAWGSKGGGMAFTPGVRGSKPQPFMYPAYERHQGEIMPAIIEGLLGATK